MFVIFLAVFVVFVVPVRKTKAAPQMRFPLTESSCAVLGFSELQDFEFTGYHRGPMARSSPAFLQWSL